MKISLIVAMAENRVIGVENDIPWHLSADLKRFKKITMGSPIIMGRKTFESIGKALPGRKNIIITRNPDYKKENCEIYDSVEQALLTNQDCEEVFIIGGSAIYKGALSMVDYIYLTLIHQNFQGDVLFPELSYDGWRELKRQKVIDDESVPFDYSFIELEKINW